MEIVGFEPENFQWSGTGSHETPSEFKVVEYPFDRYLVKVLTTPDNKFAGIVEVNVNKDFLSQVQRITALSSTGYHDVEQYYQDIENE